MATLTIDERVRKLVSEQLAVPFEEATADKALVDDLGADSLDTVELVMVLEETFNVEITDDESDALFNGGTVQSVVDLISEKVA